MALEYSLDELKSHPEFAAATPEAQQRIELGYTQDAWDSAKKDLLYNTSDVATRQQYRDAFDQSHPMGSLVRTEEESKDTSFAQDIQSQFSQGIEQTKESLEVGLQAYKDSTQSNRLAKLIAESNERRGVTYTPPALKTAQTNMAAESKRWDRALFVEEKAAALWETTKATAREVFTNPKGVALLATQSLPNVAAPIVGGFAGGYTAGPAGAGVGTFGGSFATEQGAYLLDKVVKEVQSRGQEVTEANIQAVINDRELFDKIESASYRKAAGTAGTDVLFAAVGGKVGTTALRNTQKAIATNKRKLSRIADKLKATSTEIISEPISEAAGQLAAEGKIDAGELMGEALGGIGTGPVTAPANIALFGTKEAGKKVQEITRTKPQEEVVASEQAKAPTQYKYKEKVAQAVKSDTIGEIANPESEEFNPIMAIEVAQKINQKEDVPAAKKINNQDLSQDIYNGLDNKKQAIVARATDINQKEDPTDEDLKEVGSLIKQAKSIQKVMDTVGPLIKSMGDIDADQPAILEQVNEALKGDDSTKVQESILSIFGSKKGADIAQKGILNQVLDNPKIDAVTKDQVQKVQAYQEVEESLIAQQTDADKTIEDVHIDVIEGKPGFKGIKTYAQAVVAALQSNDTEAAVQQIEALKAFATKHTNKAGTFTQVYDANISNQPVDASTQARMNEYNEKRQNRGYTEGYNLSTKNSERLVNTIAMEANALNKAVTMMESWLPTTPPTGDIGGSGTTETAVTKGDVAKAKEPEVTEVEGSVRTPVSPVKTKTTISTKDSEVLTEIGLSKGEIKKLTPKKVNTMIENKDLSIDELNTKITELPAKSKDIPVLKGMVTVKKRKQKAAKPAEVQEASIQKELTTPVKEDPDNQIKGTYKVKKTAGLLQKTDNILAALNPEYLENAGVFNEKNPMDKDAVAVINSIKDFGDQFTEAFNTQFKVKMVKKTGLQNKAFRFEDPIQYLLDENLTVPDNVINALMAASYKWLASRSSETLRNYDDDIRSILGMDDEAYVNPLAHKLIGDIGVTATLLQEALGRDTMQLLGIQPTDSSDYNSQNKLELSLGLQAIATIQSMGILQQTDVLRGAAPGKETDTVNGLHGLINSQSDTDQSKYSDLENNFFVPLLSDGIPDFRAYKGTGFSTFYKVATVDGDIKPGIENQIIDPYHSSKNTWDRIFKGENSKTNYSWEPIKKSKTPMKLKGTDFEASQVQTDNLQEHQNKPYKASPRTMNFYLLMGTANLAKIQGKKDPKTAHIENSKTVEGVNHGIDTSNKFVQDWLFDAAKQSKGYNSEFHIPEEFWRQGRMGQIGDINPQGDKTHRFLFNMTAWEQDVDLTNTEQIEQFLEAVALGLDIEVSKEGGLNQAIHKVQSLLEKPVMVEAINAIQTIFDGRGSMDEIVTETEHKELYKKEMDAITAGVLAGGVNMHSLKALIEYTRYKQAVINGDSSFNTDLSTEIDGVSNGPTIGRNQLMLDSADVAETLTALQNAGISFSNMQPGLAQHLARSLSHDAYQSVGFAWTGALVNLEKALSDKAATAKTTREKIELQQEQVQLDAMKNLFGEFRDETGNVSKVVRKLSKDPTMKTVYGMGKKTLIQELGDTFIANIYSEMEAVVVKNDVDALRDLTKNLKAITGRSVFDATAVTGTDVNSGVVLATVLTKEDISAIRENIKNYHGAALDTAITEVYGKMQDAFRPLNNGIGMTAVLYNTVRNLKVQQAQTAAIKEGREITVGELKAIDESVRGMYPNVTTAFGGQIPLTKDSKEKVYSHKAKGVVNREVRQTYLTTDKPGGIAGKKAAPYATGGVRSPGVGGVILNIHNQDSVIANMLMGVYDILNNHDGFTGGIGQTKALSSAANEIFYNTMKDYHMGTELFTATQRIVNVFLEQQKELLKAGVTQAEINNAVAAEFEAMGTFSYKPPGADKAIPITPSSYPGAMTNILQEMGRVAKETQANKEILTEAMTAVEQYSYPKGEFKTENMVKPIDFRGEKFNPLTITEEAEKRLTGAIETTKEVADSIGEIHTKDVTADPANDYIDDAVKYIVTDQKGSSPGKAKLSTNPDEYSMHQEVSAMNVLHVYDQIKDDSTVTDSPEHDAHLQNTLKDLIQNVMNPVDMYLQNNPDVEPEGVFVHTGSSKDNVFISSQNRIIGPVSGALGQGIRMSTGEVYTHELLHSVLHTGLNMNKRLRAKVETLFRIAEKELGADGYKAFLNDPTINVNDPAFKYEVEAAKERYDYVFRNTETHKVSEFYQGVDPATGETRIQERSNYLDEFIVLALTNKNFMRSLSGIKMTDTSYNSKSWKDIKGANIQEAFGNIGQIIMDFIYKRFTSRASATTMSAELRDLAILLSKKDSDRKSALFLTLNKLSKYTNKASEYGNDFIKKSVASAPVIKTANNLKNLLVEAKESNTVLGQRLREMEYAYQRLDQGIIKSTVTEIKGRTERMAWLHELLSRRQIILDQAKQNESDTYINMSNDLFTEALDDTQKTAITKVGLKTDISVLNNSLGLDGLKAVLKDKKELTKQIGAVLKKIQNNPALAPHVTYYQRAADALGHFMVFSRSRSDEIVFQSTRVIAALRNTGDANTLSTEEINVADELVDQLASLYALQYTAEGHRKVFSDLLEKDPEAVNGVLRMHEVLKDKALKESFAGNKYKFIKGYTKQILNSRINLKYGTIEDEAEFAKAGYIRNPVALPRDPEDPMNSVPFYIYVSKTERVNDLVSTVFSYTGNKAKGTALNSIAKRLGLPVIKSNSISGINLTRQKEDILQNMSDPKFTPKLTDGNFMVPQVNDTGDTTQYRYMMAEHTKDAHMEQVTAFDKILGSMAGQIVDKVKSPIINHELITGLHAVHEAGYDNNPGGFVEIGPNSEDPHLREIYYMMPPKAKKDIQKVWNSTTMFVPKDFVDISFGYRQYSIADAFIKDPKDRARMEKVIVGISEFFFKEKAVRAAGSLESAFVEMTKLAKSNIIIKSLHVTLNNLGSNMIYLKSRGVPVATIVKLGWEALAMGNKYQADSKKLDRLILKKEILQKGKYTTSQLRDINSQIARVKDAIARNPTTKTIQAGLMPSLIDDIETVTSGTNFPTEFEKKITALTERLPSAVQNVGKTVVLTEDTTAFKVLNNAVKMTDFIGRHILYNYYTQGGTDHKEAIASVEDEFVNFNVPTHRMVEYGNKIGILWFTKYATRILKVIKDSAVDKPFDVLMAYMLSTHTGLDNIANSIPGVTKDILQPLGNPFDSLIDSLDEPLPINSIDYIL